MTILRFPSVTMAVLLLALAAPRLRAQASTPAAPAPAATAAAPADTAVTARMRDRLFGFLAGSWSCEGAFANGTPIASDVTFSREMGGAWLQQRHQDRPPHRYAALSMWGIHLPSGRLAATIFDVGGGTRRFTADAWSDTSVVLLGETRPAAPDRRERFAYRVASPDSFRMSYEVTRDAGATWTLGDSLLCTQRRASR
jgi:hypothetical protein